MLDQNMITVFVNFQNSAIFSYFSADRGRTWVLAFELVRRSICEGYRSQVYAMKLNRNE